MDIIEHRSMKLSVLDENDSKPELVGDMTISLEEAFNSHPSKGYDAWHELNYKGKYAGEVYLEITFYPAKPALPIKKNLSRPSSPSKKSLRKSPSSSSKHSLPVPPVSGQGSRPLPPEPGQQLNAQCLNLDALGSVLPELNDESDPSRIHPRTSPTLGGQPSSHVAIPPRLPGRSPSPGVFAGNGSSVRHSNSKAKRKPVNGGASPLYASSVDEPLPFSPDSYDNIKEKGSNHSLRDRQHETSQLTPDYKNPQDVLDFRTYAPEPFLAKRELPVPPSQDFDPGSAGYVGEGQWDISRQINDGYGDSVFNKVVNNLPKIPPKIPLGMTKQEYDALNPAPEEDPFNYRVYY